MYMIFGVQLELELQDQAQRDADKIRSVRVVFMCMHTCI